MLPTHGSGCQTSGFSQGKVGSTVTSSSSTAVPVRTISSEGFNDRNARYNNRSYAIFRTPAI